MSNEHESSAGLGKIARDPDDDLKEALHELPYGMYVIGSSDGATPNAMIADWVMQVSFNPRLISVSYEIDSSTLARTTPSPQTAALAHKSKPVLYGNNNKL